LSIAVNRQTDKQAGRGENIIVFSAIIADSDYTELYSHTSTLQPNVT